MMDTREWIPRVRKRGGWAELHSARRVAIWTLIIVMVFVLGRALVVHLRPQVMPEDRASLQNLEDEVDHALRHIGDRVEHAYTARIEGEGDVLHLWHLPEEAGDDIELHEEELRETRFFVDDRGDLVAKSDDETRILARRIEHVHFHLVDAGHIGMIMTARDDAEFIEARHLAPLRQEAEDP